MPVWLVSVERSLPGLHMAAFSLCLPVVTGIAGRFFIILATREAQFYPREAFSMDTGFLDHKAGSGVGNALDRKGTCLLTVIVPLTSCVTLPPFLTFLL